MKVTIKDIARETGLSLATISKFLNNKKILEQNRILIEDAIRRLDYKPNRTAQTLRSKRTMTVAIILPDIGNYFWGPLIAIITQYLKRYDYAVITCSYYHDYSTEELLIQDMISRHIDGIILLPYNTTDRLYPLSQDAGIPIVLIDQIPSLIHEKPVDCVVTDNYHGGYFLAEYLLQRGHRNIYVMEPVLYSSSISQRISGIKDACSKYNTEPVIPDSTTAFISHQQIISFGKKRMQKELIGESHSTAVIFTNYATAMGGLMELSSSELSIPEDLSVVCFDDDPLFGSMHPPITAVTQNLTAIGENASEILLRRINGDYSDFPSTLSIDVNFRERSSVKSLL